MKIGVRAHDVLTSTTPKALKKEIDTLGFDGLQLVSQKVFSKAIDETLDEVRNEFPNQIFLLGAYFNMVHPNEEEIKNGISNFKKHLDVADSINAPYVGTETGSLMGSPWNYLPENHFDDTFQKVIEVVKELVEYTKDKKVEVAIEGAYAHVVYSPNRMYQLLQTINSPKLKVIVDLYNFLNIDNHANHLEIFKEALELFKEKIVIFHLKDYIVDNGKLKQVALGMGQMKYEEIIPLILVSNPNAYLIFEGVKREDQLKSLRFIKSLILKYEGGK